MASPQTENGYTKIANELLEVVVRTPLPGRHKDVVLFVIRKTYGYRKKKDRISLSQYVLGTGIDRSSICRIIKDLVAWNLLLKDRSFYALNKNYESWLVAQRSTGSGVDATKSSGVDATYKRKKETIQKKYSSKATLKDMKWKKYNENNHQDDLPAIDADSGEEIKDKAEAEKKIVTDLVDRGTTIRKKKFLDEPTQRKMIKEMLAKGFSAEKIGDTLRDLMYSDYWQKQDRLPDYKTVFSTLKNKK